MREEKQTFTLDFLHQGRIIRQITHLIVAEKRNDFLSGRITRIYLF